MASRSEIARQDQASEQRRNDACATLLQHAAVNDTADVPDRGRGVAVGVLSALIDVIEAESADVAELRRKGWQSAMKAHITAAEVVKVWRDLLVEYTPPSTQALPQPAEIAVGHRADTPAELEQRLTEAFGPELAPVRHIRTVAEPAERTGGSTVDDDADERGPTYSNLCGQPGGSFTHPGGANCPDCHALYAEQNDGKPYDGPTAHGNPTGTEILRMPVEPPIDVNVKVAETTVTPAWSDGPVTPAVAQAMREAGSFLTEAEQNEVRDLTPEELAAVQARLRPRTGIDAGGAALREFVFGNAENAELAAGLDAAAMSRINALPDASGTLAGTFDDGRLVRDGDAVSIELPNGEVVTGTAQNVVTDGLTTTADLAPLNIIEPAARRPARERMTAAQVREHGLSRQRGAEHRSVSQVQGFADCGTRAALSDLERPAWWNVGGKAFHACAETLNRFAADGAYQNPAAHVDTEALWLKHFDAQIAEQCAATPDHPMGTWRAANKGSEHYDWWRVEGPVMVQKYVVWLAGMFAEGWRIATAPSDEHPREVQIPVIEYSVNLDVGLQVPNLSIIDLALTKISPDNTVGAHVLIVDFKAGNSAPKDTFQLGVYGWCALGGGIAQHPAQVRGAYYRARKGEMTAPLPVLELNPWPDVVQRYRDQDAMERQGIYMPNVTSFCGGCGVRDLCPAQATS